jgi:O-antigen/teichoic acid export membrane protein
MVAGPEYADAARFVPPVLVGYLFYGVTYIQSAGSILRGRTVYMSIVMAVGAAVNLAGNALLIPLAGGLGAAWATFAAFACMALCMTAIARGLYPVPFERRLAGGLLAVAVLAVLALVLGSGEPGWMRLALRAGVVAFGFPAFVYALFLDAEEKLRVRRLLARRPA